MKKKRKSINKGNPQTKFPPPKFFLGPFFKIQNPHGETPNLEKKKKGSKAPPPFFQAKFKKVPPGVRKRGGGQKGEMGFPLFFIWK